MTEGGWSGILRNEGRVLNWERVTSIWYRRPREFEFDSDMSDSARRFARSESLSGLGGLLRATEAVWVNHPEKLVSAEYKPYQLAAAVRCGFEVPLTLLTNDPDAVRDFHDRCDGEIIYKTLSSGFVATEEGTRAIYTSRVKREDLADAEQIRRAACLFRELVPRRFDVRIVVVDQSVFAIAIGSPENTVDWRADYTSLSYQQHALPEPVHDALLRLTTELGLKFAAIDMILTPDGRYVFLEVNPNGQCAWLERATGAPVSSALVDLLATGCSVRGPALTH